MPAGDEPNKTLAVVKIVGLSVALLAIGAIVYFAGRRRARLNGRSHRRRT